MSETVDITTTPQDGSTALAENPGTDTATTETIEVVTAQSDATAEEGTHPPQPEKFDLSSLETVEVESIQAMVAFHGFVPKASNLDLRIPIEVEDPNTGITETRFIKPVAVGLAIMRLTSQDPQSFAHLASSNTFLSIFKLNVMFYAQKDLDGHTVEDFKTGNVKARASLGLQYSAGTREVSLEVTVGMGIPRRSWTRADATSGVQRTSKGKYVQWDQFPENGLDETGVKELVMSGLKTAPEEFRALIPTAITREQNSVSSTQATTSVLNDRMKKLDEDDDF